MNYPIDNIGWPPVVYNPQVSIYISQKFGGKWYLTADAVYNGKLWPKGTEFNSIFGFIGHNGLDIATPKGTWIRACMDGYIVEQTKKETGYGNRLCILSRQAGLNILWIYGHADDFATSLQLDWNFFERGYPVKGGDVIAYVGSSGFATGPHLHLGMYFYNDNGTTLNANNGYGGAIDPLPYLQRSKIMSNAKLVKNGQEWGFYLPATNEQAMIDKALNLGYSLPTVNEGKTIDWANLKPDITV
jgi:murein DD-endopeptidase MepM/ murein hydrolase activator NlpD